MKITLKLNIGNYQNIDYETMEYNDRHNCYAELLVFLRDWEDISNNATKLIIHLEKLLKGMWPKE